MAYTVSCNRYWSLIPVALRQLTLSLKRLFPLTDHTMYAIMSTYELPELPVMKVSSDAAPVPKSGTLPAICGRITRHLCG